MYKCNSCGIEFENRLPVYDDGYIGDALCPNCGSADIEEVEEDV